MAFRAVAADVATAALFVEAVELQQSHVVGAFGQIFRGCDCGFELVFEVHRCSWLLVRMVIFAPGQLEDELSADNRLVRRELHWLNRLKMA